MFVVLILKRYEKLTRKGECGAGARAKCETVTGNLVADAVRTFNVTGIDFALTNNGGIRAGMTCHGPVMRF